MYYSEDYSEDVLKLLWEPLKEKVSEGATIYYVPSQLLFQISLESLSLPDGSVLGSHYHFVRMSSARELVKMKSESKGYKSNSAVLYGGLQYDLEDSAMVEEAKKYVCRICLPCVVKLLVVIPYSMICKEQKRKS